MSSFSTSLKSTAQTHRPDQLQLTTKVNQTHQTQETQKNNSTTVERAKRSTTVKPTKEESIEAKTLDNIQNAQGLSMGTRAGHMLKLGIQSLMFKFKSFTVSTRDSFKALDQTIKPTPTIRQEKLSKAKAEVYALKSQGITGERLEKAEKALQEIQDTFTPSSELQTIKARNLDRNAHQESTSHFVEVWSEQRNPGASTDTKINTLLYKAEMVKKFTPENLLFIDEAHKLSDLSKKFGVDSPEVDTQLEHMVTHYVENSGDYSLNLDYQARKKAVQDCASFKELQQTVQQCEKKVRDLSLQNAGGTVMKEAKEELATARTALSVVRSKMVAHMDIQIGKVYTNMNEQLTAVDSQGEPDSLKKTLDKVGKTNTWKRKWSNFTDTMLRGRNGWETAGKWLGTGLLALTGVGLIPLGITFAKTSATRENKLFTPEDRSNLELVARAKQYDTLASQMGITN